MRIGPGRLAALARRAIAAATFDAADLPEPGAAPWSKGIALLCDRRGPADYWSAPTESRRDAGFFREHYRGAAGIVWVRLGTACRQGLAVDLDHFVAGALPTIDQPFVLVTTDGDASVPGDLRPDTVAALLASPHLAAWYTQNHDGGAEGRIRPFPIGLDLHTPRPLMSPRRLLDTLRRIAGARQPAASQAPRILCDFGVAAWTPARGLAVKALSPLPHAVVLRRRLGQAAIWRRYADHPFVLSLPGNGLDCHRTWEALLLGSIVVTTISSLDPLFDGLAVVRIADLSALDDPANLVRWQAQYGPLAAPDAVARRLDPAAALARMRARHLVSLPEPRDGSAAADPARPG